MNIYKEKTQGLQLISWHHRRKKTLRKLYFYEKDENGCLMETTCSQNSSEMSLCPAILCIISKIQSFLEIKLII